MPPKAPEHPADAAKQGVEAAAAVLHMPEIAEEEPEQAIGHEEDANPQPEALRVGVVQKEHADRRSHDPARDERQDLRPFEAAPKRDERRKLAEQRAEHRERGGRLRRQRPGPDGECDAREGKARHALREAGRPGAGGDDQA